MAVLWATSLGAIAAPFDIQVVNSPIGDTSAPFDVQVETRDNGVLVSTGTLNWSFTSAYTDIAYQTQPGVPDPSGLTTASLMATRAGSYGLVISWDPDGAGPESAISVSPNPYFVFVDAINSVTPVGTPPTVLTFLDDPASAEFVVEISVDGQPAPDSECVEWSASSSQGSSIYGCTPTLGGQASLPFDVLLDGLGWLFQEDTFLITATYPSLGFAKSIGTGQQSHTFSLAVTGANLTFVSPPAEIIAGAAPTTFTLKLADGLGNGIPGHALQWSQFDGVGSINPTSGTTAATNAAGEATFSTAGVTEGIIYFDASISGNPDVAASHNLNVVSYGMTYSSDPTDFGPYFGEEPATPAVIYVEKNSGGSPLPEAGVPVTFTITSGDAVFQNSGTTTVVVASDANGLASSGVVLIGRTGDDILIEASAPNRTPLPATYDVVASNYTMVASSAASFNIDDTQNAVLEVQVRRDTGGTPSGLPDADVSWSVDPAIGSLAPPTSPATGSDGLASTTFTPQLNAPGTYTVTATFDPMITGVPAVTVDFTVNVTAPSRTLALISPPGGEGRNGDVLALTVQADDDGSFSTVMPQINWQIDASSVGSATITPNSTAGSTDGRATANLTFTGTPGLVVVKAHRADNPDATVTFPDFDNYRFVLSPPSASDATPSGPNNTPIALNARLQREGIATTDVDGALVHFQILSGPTGHSAFLTPESDTTVAGLVGVAFQADLDGTYTVQAEYPMGAPTTTASYTVTVAEQIFELVFDDPLGGAADAEVGIARELVVSLSQGGAGLAGQTIEWSVSPTAAGTLSSPSSATDAGGKAVVTFTPSQTGPALVTATYNGPTPGKAIQAAPLSESVTITGFAREMAPHASPAGPNYTDETIDGVVTETFTFDGTSNTPEDGVAVSFDIISGVATFVGGATTANAVSVGGFASSPAIVLGRDLADIVVRATATGRTPVEFTLPVTASSYAIRLDAGQSDPAQTLPSQPASLMVVVERTGSAGATPLAAAPVSWSASGGTLSLPSSFTDASGVALNDFSATAIGNYTITATFDPLLSGQPPTTVQVAVEVVEFTQTLMIVSGNGQSALAGQPLGQPLVVEAQDNGALPASPVTVEWSVSPTGAATLDATSTPTAAATGKAQVNVTLAPTAAPGSVTITATRTDSSRSTSFTATVQGTVVKTLSKPATGSGDGQSGPLGSTLTNPLRAVAQDSDLPAAGVTVNWQVNGDASLDATQTVTDSSGATGVALTFGSTPGPITVTASRADAPAATTSYVVTAVALDTALTIVGGNGQRGPVQTAGAQPLQVELRDANGAPDAAAPIAWSVLSGPLVLDQSETLTDGNGRTSVSFRYGDTPGVALVRASSSDGSASVDFMLEATTVVFDGPLQGNGQSAPPGQELAEDFVLRIAPPPGKSLAGVTVGWEVIEGGGSLRFASTQTDGNGEARNRLTLGPAPGNNRVRAVLPGGAEAVFEAEAVGIVGELRLVSGDGQTVPTNDPSQPLVVELVDGSGQPLQNVTITWTAPEVQIGNESRPNAGLDADTTQTDAQGRSSNIARVLLPGLARVQAEVADSAIPPVMFELAGGVANIPTLDPRQQETSEVIDAACPALAALASRTPEQEDLYQRCLELIDNAGDNPDEVEQALDQLPPQLTNSMVDAGFETLDAQFNNMNTRFQTLRQPNGNGNGNQFNVGLWTPTGVLPLGLLPYAVGADDATSDNGEAGSGFDRWGFFATGTIGRGKSREDGQNPGFDFDTSGLTLGVDYRFTDRLVAGVSLGYARHDSEVRGNFGNLDTRGWTVNGYASWFNERNWYLDGVLSYGSNSYTLDRFIRYSITALDGSRTNIDQRARGETDGDLLGAAVSFGRDFQKGPWNLGTYLRGNYSRVDLDGYDERMLSDRPGSGLGLRYQSRTLNSFTTSLGGKATYVLSRDWGILMPTAQVEWEHEFRDDPARLTASFINDPTQSLLQQFGSEVDTDYFNVGVGLSALFPGGRSVYVFYEQLMGASRLSQGTLSIGGRIEF